MITFLILLIITESSFGQSRTITGTVTTEGDNRPLPGVSVTLKGAERGTVTDEAGKFQITVLPTTRQLVFSYTGFVTQEVNIEGRQTITISLAADDSQQLSEVVVTAMGLERQKKSLGYSATVVNGAPLAQARETNIINSLKGRVAGVYINQGAGGPPVRRMWSSGVRNLSTRPKTSHCM
jgi:hypothetical protein